MTFEEFVATRLPALLRFAAVLTGERALAEDAPPTSITGPGQITPASTPIATPC